MTHYDEYYRIIYNRKANPLSDDQFGENHHIKPRSIYPELEKDNDNIIRLSASEHFLCHYHLWKYYRDEIHDKTKARKMMYAFQMMKRLLMKCDNIEELSKLYEEARTALSQHMKKKMTGQHHSAETLKKISKGNCEKQYSVEARRKMSEMHRGENNEMFGKHHSEESKRKNAEAHRGKHPSEETRRKMSEAKRGKPLSEEACRKLSEARRGNRWFNNGVKNVFAKECPDGFAKGRMRK